MPLFDLTNFDFLYDNCKILDNINLHINAGEKVAIIGASGAGKSTLLKVLSTQRAAKVAYCAQGEHLINNLTAFNNIYMAQLENASVWKNLFNLIKPNPKALNEIKPIAASLNIDELLMRSVKNLSGGQKQRVAIARTFYCQKSIFIGDEVTSNLDATLAEKVLATILLAHPTCIIALHNRHLALSHFDRIIGLAAGQIVLDSSSAHLRQNDLDFLY